MPKVSIIVPIYNAQHYLRACIESVLGQSVSDWELLLVDDGSTDDSLHIAETFAKQDKRIRVLTQAQAGQGAARNRALELAHGEYIAFLDADDWWDTDYLERHLNEIDGHDLVQSGYRRVADGQISEERRPRHRLQFASACMRLYRSELLKNIRFIEGTYYEDILWTMDLLAHKPDIHICSYIGYNYRYNPDSTTAHAHPEDEKRIYEQIKNRGINPMSIYFLLKLKLHFLLKR